MLLSNLVALASVEITQSITRQSPHQGCQSEDERCKENEENEANNKHNLLCGAQSWGGFLASNNRMCTRPSSVRTHESATQSRYRPLLSCKQPPALLATMPCSRSLFYCPATGYSKPGHWNLDLTVQVRIVRIVAVLRHIPPFTPQGCVHLRVSTRPRRQLRQLRHPTNTLGHGTMTCLPATLLCSVHVRRYSTYGVCMTPFPSGALF